jgi:hypothetical protein
VCSLLTIPDEARFSLASHLALLRNCAAALARLLKRCEPPLLAAKVWVLSRLTHKILSQNGATAPPPLVESLWRRLEALRRRLLLLVDRRLCDRDAEPAALVGDLCAYALAASAAPSDALKYFHRARLKAIEAVLAEGSEGGATAAVELLIRTIKISQTVFPKRLADALARLKDAPLLQQKDVTSLADLDLDLHKRWIAEELRNYTPWPRHDELQKADAEKLLKAWTKRAFSTFAQGLESRLSQIDSFADVLSARREVFQNWPWSAKRLPALDAAETIDDLRELMNNRLRVIIRIQVDGLSKVADALSKSLTELPSDYQSSKSLWAPDLLSMEAGNGAAAFKLEVKAAYEGDEPVCSALVRQFVAWTAEVKPLVAAVRAMRDDHWDDDLGDDDDMDNDSRQVLLSEDDPRLLERSLSDAMKRAVDRFQTDVDNTVVKFLRDDVEETLARAIISLRFIRGVSRHPVIESGQALKFSAATISLIQSRLVKTASGLAIAGFKTSFATFAGANRLSAKLIWEGSPALPTLPSPAVFQLLYKLTERMSSFGLDLWSTDTVLVLKSGCFKEVMEHIKEYAQSLSEPDVDEPAAEDSAETDSLEEPEEDGKVEAKGSKTKDKATQLLFDMLYLQRSLSSGASPTVFDGAFSTLSGIADLGEPEMSRLKRSSREYWRRTYLIFALLCTESSFAKT